VRLLPLVKEGQEGRIFGARMLKTLHAVTSSSFHDVGVKLRDMPDSEVDSKVEQSKPSTSRNIELLELMLRLAKQPCWSLRLVQKVYDSHAQMVLLLD